ASTLRDTAFQQVEREIEPKLAAWRDRIVQNEKLFGRIAAVYEARDKAGLTAEQKRLAWLRYTEFARTGAKLDPAAKERLTGITQRLAALYTQFGQNVLADERSALVLDREEDLAGLSPSLRSAAAAAAETRGEKGQWAVLNTRSSVEPFLSYSDRRGLREKA